MGKLANDLAWGAAAIAREIFGSDTEQSVRKVYHLHESGVLPTMKMGGAIVARRSQLQQTFRVQTEKAAPS
jgi:hypothetical protein